MRVRVRVQVRVPVRVRGRVEVQVRVCDSASASASRVRECKCECEEPRLSHYLEILPREPPYVLWSPSVPFLLKKILTPFVPLWHRRCNHFHGQVLVGLAGDFFAEEECAASASLDAVIFMYILCAWLGEEGSGDTTIRRQSLAPLYVVPCSP